MMRISVQALQIAGVAAGLTVAAGAGLWLLSTRRPTEDEVERERCESLVSFGRLVDGTLLDSFQITTESGTTRNMLLFGYEISGVSYECSQDITRLGFMLEPGKVKLGMPCTIRYQPGSPENSIVVSERWSGLREGLPMVWPPLEGRTDSAI